MTPVSSANSASRAGAGTSIGRLQPDREGRIRSLSPPEGSPRADRWRRSARGERESYKNDGRELGTMEPMSEQVIAPTGRIDEPMVERAVARAARWSAASAGGADAATRRLASLVHDPDGVEFALRFVDRVARPDDDHVAAPELARLAGRGATLPGFANVLDRTMLRTGAVLAPRIPRVVVPLARRRLKQLVGHLVVDASDRSLGRHLAAARAHGRRLNLNLLGEAVLGEQEADRRLERHLH